MANIVSDHFAITQQRDAVIQSLVQQLSGVQSEKTVKAQWEAYIALQRNVRGLEDTIAEASQELRKGDAKYVQALIEAQKASFKARQAALAKTTTKKIDAEAEGRKYHRGIADKIKTKLSTASGKLRKETSANIATAGANQTKKQAIFERS